MHLKKQIPFDIWVALSLFFISFLISFFFKLNISNILISNIDLIYRTIYLSIIATIIATLIHFIVPPEFVEKHLNRNSLLFLFYATVLGILTPGPVWSIYPLLQTLKKKGIQNSLLVSYITGQTIIGPARIPFEIGFIGLNFFLYRIMIALIFGPLAGLAYIALSKIWPDRQ